MKQQKRLLHLLKDIFKALKLKHSSSWLLPLVGLALVICKVDTIADLTPICDDKRYQYL